MESDTMRHRFIGFLGRRIERNWVVGYVVLGKRDLPARPVHGAGRCEDKVLDIVLSANFENVREPHQIACHIRLRVLNRIANTRLRCKMHHPDRFRCGENPGEGRRIFNACSHEGKFRSLLESRKSGLFQPYIIVGIEVIQSDDVPLALQKPTANM